MEIEEPKKEITPKVHLSPLELKIFKLVASDPKITKKKIAEKLGIGWETVKEYIKRIKVKGAIKREGVSVAGWWKVVGD